MFNHPRIKLVSNRLIEDKMGEKSKINDNSV